MSGSAGPGEISVELRLPGGWSPVDLADPDWTNTLRDVLDGSDDASATRLAEQAELLRADGALCLPIRRVSGRTGGAGCEPTVTVIGVVSVRELPDGAVPNGDGVGRRRPDGAGPGGGLDPVQAQFVATGWQRLPGAPRSASARPGPMEFRRETTIAGLPNSRMVERIGLLQAGGGLISIAFAAGPLIAPSPADELIRAINDDISTLLRGLFL